MADRRLSLDVRGEGVTDKPLVLAAELPLVLQLEPFRFDLPGMARSPASSMPRSQLARLADARRPRRPDRLEGLLSAALTVGGTVGAPRS